jgi:uncharacterized protein (UPF0335 family)
MKVIKASGLEETFSSRKIYRTLIEAGSSGKLAREIIGIVKKEYHEDMTTQEILNIVLRELKDFPDIRARYDLKRAIMTLGPSGFPFEIFFGSLLKEYNYDVKVHNFVKGNVITHEVDILAEDKETRKNYMIECKYHNESGTSTTLHPALYTYARFLDLNSKERPDIPWLVTNTKCSKDALGYAQGVGLRITSWNFPKDKSLQKLINQKGLYPITILKTINHKTKEKLFQSKIIIAKNLLNHSVNELMQKTELSEKEIQKILEEVKEVCKIK